jgi:hypothetical protein
MNQFGVKKQALKDLAQTPDIPTLQVAGVRGDETSRTAVIGPRAVYWLGAELHGLHGEEFSAFGVRKEDGGVALAEVPEGSGAAKAGLQVNDLIQGINGLPVSDVDQFFNALVRSSSNPLKLKLVRNQQSEERTIAPAAYIEVEVAPAAGGFRKLPLPAPNTGKVAANPRTQNDPIASLTDGKLASGYGPVFGNGVDNGAYKMDLGRTRTVRAITSWSHYQNQHRGIQKLAVAALHILGRRPRRDQVLAAQQRPLYQLSAEVRQDAGVPAGLVRVQWLGTAGGRARHRYAVGRGLQLGEYRLR